MFKGKHCLITGGSQGLGRAVACQLATKGAHITIMARGAEQLKASAAEINRHQLKEEQRINWIQADVTDKNALKEAFAAAEAWMGRPAEIVLACAGMAKPGLFVEQDLDEFDEGIRLNYLGALYTAKIAAERMVANDIKGHIVFVSSTVGLMGLVGYSQYAPSKFALRGLAECLRQELILYDISTHIYFVSTIHTEGYRKENERKPALTRRIEDSESSDPSPENRAKALINGLEKGQFMITSDWETDLIRVSALGINRASWWIKDVVLLIASWIALPFWRRWADGLVKAEAKAGKKKC